MARTTTISNTLGRDIPVDAVITLAGNRVAIHRGLYERLLVESKELHDLRDYLNREREARAR